MFQKFLNRLKEVSRSKLIVLKLNYIVILSTLIILEEQ